MDSIDYQASELENAGSGAFPLFTICTATNNQTEPLALQTSGYPWHDATGHSFLNGISAIAATVAEDAKQRYAADRLSTMLVLCSGRVTVTRIWCRHCPDATVSSNMVHLCSIMIDHLISCEQKVVQRFLASAGIESFDIDVGDASGVCDLFEAKPFIKVITVVLFISIYFQSRYRSTTDHRHLKVCSIDR